MKTLLILLAFASALGQAVAEDFQVSGVVVDHATNRPLNHVLVQLVRISKGGGDVSAVTSEDGRFNFLHVPKGKYSLQAQKRGQMPERFEESDGGYASAIVVDGTMKTDNLVFALRTGAHIDGTVIGDDSEPIRNAQVLLFREVVLDGAAQTVRTSQSYTNSTGHFHIGHLEQGKYYVAVLATPWFAQPGLSQPGLTQNQLVYPVTFYGDATDAGTARTILLPEGGSADIQINLRTVQGIHVKLPATVRGVALSVPGPGDSLIPVPLQYLDVFRGSHFSRPTPRAPAVKGPVVSNDPGALLLPMEEAEEVTDLSNLAAGRYKAAVVGENGGFAQTTEFVELTNGSTLNLNQSASSSITGKIVFEGTEPHHNLQILIGGRNDRRVNAEVGPDGAFHFEKVATGTYELNVTDPQLKIVSISARGANVVHDDLEIPSGVAVEVTVKVTAAASLPTFQGVAIHDGHGMAGVMVLLMPQNASRTRLIRRDQSDADGSFSLSNILPGRYTLIAIDDGHDLAYKTESVVKPYLAGGLALTFPLASNDPVQVPVQARQP